MFLLNKQFLSSECWSNCSKLLCSLFSKLLF